jgi:hypothetical protein
MNEIWKELQQGAGRRYAGAAPVVFAFDRALFGAQSVGNLYERYLNLGAKARNLGHNEAWFEAANRAELCAN